jgi:hypothetical protein
VCSRGSGKTPANKRQCKCCKPGFFLAAGVKAASCTPCAKGQWGPLYGQTACRKCPRNLVSLSAGSRVCDGELRRQADTGSDSATVCRDLLPALHCKLLLGIGRWYAYYDSTQRMSAVHCCASLSMQ